VSDPKQGVSVANKFVADGVKFVVGHFNSGVSIPASEVYAENGILVITPACHQPAVHRARPVEHFRTCGRDDQQGAVAGAYLAANFKDAKIAVIHDKTPYGQGLADETKKAMNAAGVTEVMYEGVNIGDKDFSALIAKMKEAGVTIVYWGGLHTEAGLIIRQAADQGLKATLHVGRRHRVERTRLDRRRRGRRHADDVRSGSDARTRTTRNSSRSSRPPASTRKPTRSTPTLRAGRLAAAANAKAASQRPA
jgi:ABC-type branched-subunit amino acid transport system substrate-binding protein